MTTRKLLFLVFTNDACKLVHALMHARDLTRRGHEVKIILDGEATRSVALSEGRTAELFEDVLRRGIIAGACETATRGCSESDASRDLTASSKARGIPLMGELDGHAGIGGFVDAGFELVVF